MSRTTSQAAVEKAAFATSKGSARTVGGKNVSATTKYIFVFDNASAASGTQLYPPITVLPGQTVMVSFDPTWLRYSNGLYLASSSTDENYAATTTADFRYHVDVVAP